MSSSQPMERLAAGEGERQYVFWDRGGPPGRGYEADHLLVTMRSGGSELLFRKTRFDPTSPPYRTDHYVLNLPEEQVVDPTQLAGAVFAEEFPEEKDPRIGGVTKITMRFVSGDENLEKTFFQRVPPVLGPAYARAKELMARCEREGTLTHVTRPRA